MSTASLGSAPRRIGEALRRAGSRPVTGRPRLRPRTLLAIAAALILCLVGWLWLRDSSLVAVRSVEVSGIAGAQGARIRAALDDAARSMTTLHVRAQALDTAVAPFSLVKRIEVETSFPHTMRIHVVTNVAVGAVKIDGRRIPVTSDGTLLRDVSAPASLPDIPLSVTPGGTRLEDSAARAAVATLAAAPEALRIRVTGIVTTPAHGLTLKIANGPILWFGSDERLGAKWAAAAAVLADPAAAGATSIDVAAPERPAVSGLPGGASATGESDVPTPPATAAGTDPTAPASTTDQSAPAAGSTP